MSYLLENLGLKYAFIGCGVAVLCLIIPLVHFVSGPLSPLIGGWVAGSMAKAGMLRAVWLGVLMSGLLAGALLAILPVVSSLLPGIELPQVTDGGLVILLFAGVLAVGVVLASVGAAIGGSMARKSRA
ncbi:MAG: hypothetical protein OYI31_07700 [Chloroflexota bacterium]|nr:hypothetical protein [Chloroflexota bacterium]MDE2941841.1 hypothetical protein [Chloroflexota bacterium]MDE3268313.1 hypothetical protein [Chloroflexota bacterium]